MSPGAAEMGDVKPAIPLHPDDSGDMEARFLDLCKNGLALDESMTRQAMVLFRETKPILLANISAIGGGTPEEFERFWSASVLYCIARLGRWRSKEDNGEGGIKLCQILRAAKLKVVDFFKEFPQFSLKVGHILRGLYGSDWEKRLEVKELQTNVVHLSLLSRYYNRIYNEFFLPRDRAICQHSTDSGSMGYTSDCYQFGWLLFLTLRVHAFSRFKDLVTCTNGLISILALLIVHIPVRFRKFRIQDSPIFAKKSNQRVNLLASLCGAYHTSEDELGRMMEKVYSLIAVILKKRPYPASECQMESLEYINADGLMYFENLLEEKSLRSSLLILAKDYADAINIKGELDERMFANDEDSLLGTGSLSGGAVNLSGTKRKLDAITSPAKTMTGPLCPCSPSSPVNSKFSGNTKVASVTPVSTAMTTAKWLRDVVSPLLSKPSVELERFLSSRDKDMTSDVIRRANIILEAIFPNSSSFQDLRSRNTNLVDNIWAEQRRSEALKLYYRVLEAICRAESQMSSGNNLTSLLSNERFNRCMLACSAELVLATHKTVTMMFPSVLEKSGITSFDLSKVIESFVRHEETLPRELKRHLNSLEERLLESMAWEKGSSMYNSLIVARPSLSTEINRLRLLAEPMISLDVIAKHYNISNGGFPPLHFQKSELQQDWDGSARYPNGIRREQISVSIEHDPFTSPVKKHPVTLSSLKSRLPLLQSAFASPTRPNPVRGETCAETEISVFFNKIVKMAAIRIRSLCERLQLSQQVLECIYYLFQQVLSQRTCLFFNRHVDQLILCSFYGVAKISRLSLTFKEIIYNYRKLPQCKPQVFRSVFVSWPSMGRKEKTGEDHVDIITFYNELFIPSVKPLLVELGTAGVAQKNQKLNEKNDSYGQIPGSPRLSPFPNLPDMSPKKVLASHNVYVSPMRQSKMDALLSPSSKSYYACVGESTQAYQSPSKDLTAINDRLNCGSGRKINGRLNFDVVSDSVVASSLGSLNSGSMCSDDASPFKLPLKSEQSDT